ncbi:MAG TPA: carbonic anhydrase [Gemmatimonadales bacterium]|jgi:carbonic anhydrase
MSEIDEVLKKNQRFSGARSPVFLPLPPARHLAIVTCMDARLDPSSAFGLAEGDAHVIRNAGGRAQDALRSLVISQRLLGTTAITVVHHTDCGMLTFANDDLYKKVEEDLGSDASGIDFLPFPDLQKSVRDDVEFLRNSLLIAPNTEIRGFVYDVKTGQLSEVTAGAETAGSTR